MKERQGTELPTLPIGFNDLAALRSVISGHLAFLRRGGARTQQERLHIQMLEGVYQRLTGISAQAVEVRIFLSVPEVEALNIAIIVFMEFVRLKVLPSRSRDETLLMLELLRQYLLRMLPNNDG